MSKASLVVVGASLAGAKAVEGARAAGFDGRVLLIGDEPTLPYERPPLSKAMLRGEKTESALVHPQAFYADNEVELVNDRVIALDLYSRKVELTHGSPISFDSLILATGAQPRRLEAPGSDLDGVHYLRTIQDAVRLHDAVRGATRVAVIGAGWIGSEVAASARQIDASVVLIDPAPAPLQRVVGHDLGAVFRQLHADHGVALRLGASVIALQGDRTVSGVVLDDGTVEEADVVIVGIGATPAVQLADEAVGLRVSDGVVVDRHLHTNVDGVFAAGDVANAWHPHFRRHLRVEHWANARDQGITAGRNAAGANESYDQLPYFFSDQYDLGLEYVGHHQRGDDVVVRGDLHGRQFIALWHRDGAVTAGMAVNIWDTIGAVRSLILSRVATSPARLADTDVALHELSAAR